MGGVQTLQELKEEHKQRMQYILSFIIKAATCVVILEGFGHYMENLPGSPLKRMCFVLPFLISANIVKYLCEKGNAFVEANAAPIMLTASIWGICEVNSFLHPTKFTVSPL